MIIVQSRRTPLEKIQKQFDEALIFDVTSRSSEPWVRFSPFYPHNGIPVPFSSGWVSASVEGIWQGLKVFEGADVDTSKFCVSTMRNLKRSTKVYGKVLGHRKGIEGNRLLSYIEARYAIYLPSYYWVLEKHLQDLLSMLKRFEHEKAIVLLDYTTNTDIHDGARPLSHAGLIKLYIENQWPHTEIALYADR